MTMVHSGSSVRHQHTDETPAQFKQVVTMYAGHLSFALMLLTPRQHLLNAYVLLLSMQFLVQKIELCWCM